MKATRVFSAALGLALSSQVAFAADDADPPSRLTQKDIESWLENPNGASKPLDDTAPSDAPPPPPPRAHGFFLKGRMGALGHVGALKNLSPTAPHLGLATGYELFDWLGLFVEADLVFATTGYGHPPPKPRSYTLYGFGAGLHFAVPFSERFGAELEGSVGLSEVIDDILGVYGYKKANDVSAYFGGHLGLQWYPVNPHYTVSLIGGVRDYLGLQRTGGSRVALAWHGGLALTYAF